MESTKLLRMLTLQREGRHFKYFNSRTLLVSTEFMYWSLYSPQELRAETRTWGCLYTQSSTLLSRWSAALGSSGSFFRTSFTSDFIAGKSKLTQRSHGDPGSVVQPGLNKIKFHSTARPTANEISVSVGLTDKAIGHFIAQESNMCSRVMGYSLHMFLWSPTLERRVGLENVSPPFRHMSFLGSVLAIDSLSKTC